MGSLGILLFFEDNSIKMEYHTNQMSNYSEYNENGAFFRGPHYTNSRAAKPTRDPKQTNAYLVGGGIASLAAAVHLIQDANVPASQIHILESGPVPGGSMDGAGNSESGYILRGGRMLNFSYLCTYDMLSRVPSLTDPKKTVKQEIDEFNAIAGNKTNAHARLVAKGVNGPEIMDVTRMGLNNKQRLDLVKLAEESEMSLGAKRISECFTEDFFNTKFWYMWDTMYDLSLSTSALYNADRG